MRILYVINSFDPGGAEHGLLSLIDNHFFGGNDLKILALCHGRGNLAERVISSIGAENVTICSPDTSLSISTMMKSTLELRKMLRNWSPDAAVLSLKQANVIGRLLLIFFPRIYCISFEHISKYRARRGEGMYAYILRALSFRVDEVWADCLDTLTETQHYFSRRRRHKTVVPLFCAHDAAAYKTNYELAKPLKIAVAGRLVGRKRPDLAISAVRRLRDNGASVFLKIFGSGPEEDRLKKMVESVALTDAVKFMGYQSKWLEGALDCDIFLNLSNTEGFCIVVAEAMSAGIPVIATNVGGIREYGKDGENIIILHTHDLDDIITAINKLAKSFEDRKRIGQAARDFMLRTYSSGSMSQCGRDIFLRLSQSR